MKQILCGLVVLVSCILAAAQNASPAQAEPRPAVSSDAQAATPLPTVPLLHFYLRPGNKADSTVSWFAGQGRIITAPGMLSASCYTMRVYRVKWTERLAAGDNGRLGYSTCEPGWEFQVRTAVATPPEQKDAK